MNFEVVNFKTQMRGFAIVSPFQPGDEVFWASNGKTLRTGCFGGMRDDGTLILFLRNERSGILEKTEFPNQAAHVVLGQLEITRA